MKGVEIVAEHRLATPFGKPSDAVVETRIGDQSVYFLPRHGRRHVLLPSEVPYRAQCICHETDGRDASVVDKCCGNYAGSYKTG